VGIGLVIGIIPTGGGKNVNDRVQQWMVDHIWRPDRGPAVWPPQIPGPIPQTQSTPCTPEEEAECRDQFEADNDVCRSLPNRTKEEKAVRSRCWDSAAQRLGACRQKLPLPPLVTW
jgi:hypothetical protein